MSVLSDLAALRRAGARRLAIRRASRQNERILAGRPALPVGSIEVVVYFTDLPVNLYQLRQWYEPLRRLDERHRVAVVARSARSTRILLDECPVPVVPIASVAELEPWLASHPVRVMCYVNQTARNFTALRFTEPAHVFLNHGESDKAYMASNQVKAYDAVLVAGPAAVRRIHENLYDAGRTHLVEIGRPQVDVEHVAPQLPEDERSVVLYAPTWEGDRPSNSYSSVASHGEAAVASLVDSDRYRVVYRPHPRTGALDRQVAAAHGRIVERLQAANRSDPRAAHVVDQGGQFGWQLGVADVCLTDVSAVAYDWAATGKPLVLTLPTAPGAVVDRSGLTGAVPLLEAGQAGGVAERLDALLAEGPSPRYAEVVADHFGDTSPGLSMQRFLDAMESIISRRAEQQAERASRQGAS